MSQRLGDPHELHFLAQPPMSYLSVADSAGVIPDLAFDYDLSSATVHHLRVDRAGTHLTAFLQLAVVRTFATDESASTQPALLQLALEDLIEVAFDFRDTQGAVLDPAADEIAISVGAGGRFRAASAECHPDDRSWYLSAAGRRTDAVTPPRTDQPSALPRPPVGKLGADAEAAAVLLHHSMLEIRSVGYAARADHVPARGLCEAFPGAGQLRCLSAVLATRLWRLSRTDRFVNRGSDRTVMIPVRFMIEIGRSTKGVSLSGSLGAPEMHKHTSAADGVACGCSARRSCGTATPTTTPSPNGSTARRR
ncbi:hypothetical protein OG763_10030 [Streptomyces sp. NBC_01230]|uniref:hypothetical protein n=1 Tax=unclassified Streptomyces TaxID=2593676 RepID=UPI002E136B83|nr:hypothetical protein OG763_10030 [Streptomyces sp. NBC_01230]